MNLSVQIFASLVLSVVVGLVLGDGAIGPVKTWVAPVGTMFINLIKMMIVPVVLCSLVVGMTSMGDLKKLGIVEEIVEEPGEFTVDTMPVVCEELRGKILRFLEKYEKMDGEEMVEERYRRFRDM